jgi:curved DNA-binding protein CbpA
VPEEPFVDHYEVLQVSVNADTETIQRVYRHLAKRYHPDNQQSGDSARFEQLVKAHGILTSPEQRAAYDVKHQHHLKTRAQLAHEAAGGGYEQDRLLRARILSMLYVQRRREVKRPGVGPMDLCEVLACPYEHLEFHLWYLRQRKFVEITENGQMAITVEGCDQVEKDELLIRADRLLTERGQPDVSTASGPQQIAKTGTR